MLKKLHLISLAVLYFSAINFHAQTVPTNTRHLGPGGVGGVNGMSDLILWSKAENITALLNLDPVQTWSDASGYSSDLTQPNTTLQPLFLENNLNGYNALRFDVTAAATALDGKRLVKTSFTNFPTTAISGFYINKTSDTSDGVLSYASPASNNNFLIFRSGNLRMYRNTPRTYSLSSNTGLWNIVGFGWASAGGISRMSLNGTNGASVSSIQSGNAITAGGDFSLAGEQDGSSSPYSFDPGQAHQGDFAEVIIYNTYINNAERIIVSNYLSAKYNIGITAGTDFYTQDNGGSGNFDHDVAGIGQATDGSNHTDSQGTGIVRIYNPSALTNDEFLFWGRNNKDDLTFATNNSNYKERISAKWRVSKRNDVGNVSFILDINGIDISEKQSCANLNLVVDNDSDLLSPTTTYELTDVGGNLYKANNVVFADNDYFTIEYQDLIVVDDTQFYNGSGTSNVPNTSDDCYKLLVKSAADGTLPLTEDADVREVEIENGGKLVVNSGFRLQVENGLEINGDLRLVGDAQLIQKHTGTSLNTGTGNLFKDQNSDLASVYRYNYWSSPVGATYTVAGAMKDGTTPTSAVSNPPDLSFTTGFDGSTGPLTLSSYWIYGYINGTDGSSWDQKFESGIFNAGEGFLLKSPGSPQNYTFKGMPNDGDITFTIDADKTSLLGNPYPSALDANQLFIESTNIAALYFWEHKNELVSTGIEGHIQNGYIGGYSTRNAVMGTAATAPVIGTAGLGGATYTAPGRYIPVGQGFFVETASGLPATVNFTNNQRFYETEAGDSFFFKTKGIAKKEETPILKIGFEAQNDEAIYLHHQIGISFKEGNTTGFDIGFDSKKYEIGDSDIYINFPEIKENLVIAGIADITDDLQIPITLKINASEEVFLMVDEKLYINKEVFLLDKLTNTTYNIENPIKLNLVRGTYTDRFFIAFSKRNTSNEEDDTTLGEEDLFLQNFNYFYDSKNKQIVLENLVEESVLKVMLFNLLGQEVISANRINYKKNKIEINTAEISKTVYVLKIKTTSGVFAKKIVLD